MGLSDVPVCAESAKKAKLGAKTNFFGKLFYTRDLGYQKKRIDSLSSEKVILAVPDVLLRKDHQAPTSNTDVKVKSLRSNNQPSPDIIYLSLR